ncbi:GFA family protein [Phenylobacterium aquaticum]|uniref:GFA family protein n=2 Tax=Phenylobacterium aquaticum TaxID=1763816 RepID=UPI0026EF7A6F|nr:GFA family protein [Phenylobacterium aquaticum]
MFEGGCACGAVRYRLTRRPMFVNCCHCRDCQRQCGAAFAINALIETAEIVVECGEIAPIRMPTDSGRVHDIHRCTACGTALWSDYGGRPALRFVRVATLDDPAALVPDAHIFTRSKLSWVEVTGAPAFEVYYDMQALWPVESLARRRAILGDG